MNKIARYRIEFFLGYLLFFSSFIAAIYTGNVAWVVIGWISSAVLQIHLFRLRCPTCHKRLLGPTNKKLGLAILTFPKKCPHYASSLENM